MINDMKNIDVFCRCNAINMSANRHQLKKIDIQIEASLEDLKITKDTVIVFRTSIKTYL